MAGDDDATETSPGTRPSDAVGQGAGTTEPGQPDSSARAPAFTALVVAPLADALWRRPSAVPRWLPVDDGSSATPAPLFGGVCAGIAARTGRSAASVRWRFALLIAPALAYPLLWLVRLAGRPRAEGRERSNSALLLAAVSVGVAFASAAELSRWGVGDYPAALVGAALCAPLLALGRSVLLVWRLMTPVLLAVPLLFSPTEPSDVPFPLAALALYLVVLFLVGGQQERPVTTAVGVCTAATAVVATLLHGSAPGAVVWSAVVSAAALTLGDNVRMRRAYAGRLYRTAPSRYTHSGAAGAIALTRGVAAPAVGTDALPPAPAAPLVGETTGDTTAPGGRATHATPRGGSSSADGDGGSEEPSGYAAGPLPVVRAVADALWHAPVGRPQGPLRLLHGPRRPTEGRIVAGVCAGLARGSQPMAITLRVLFPLASFPLGAVVYLLLWMVLPSARDYPANEEGEAEGDRQARGRSLPPLLPREVTAWFLLLGVSGAITSLVAVQLVQFHQVPVLPSVLLAFTIGLPFALLPTAPLLTWRIMAAGLLAVLIAVGTVGSPPQDLWPWPVAALLALPVVLYLVAVNYPGWTTIGVGTVTVVADIAAAYPLAGTHPAQTAWIAVVAAAVLLFGYNVRGRRAAQHRLARESALRRRDRARQAVLEERSRIARELHDVVSHHMSMIAIQADAAPYKFPGLETGTATTFTAIRDAARDALAEMRRVVGLLREEGEAAEHAPQPGLELIPDLVEGARQAAMDITLEGGAQAVRDAARDLPDAVNLSAYRIVQESVSNAGRHAPGAPVTISLARTPRVLSVRVVNGPPATESEGSTSAPSSAHATAFDSGGHGLVGMRERVAMLGGRLRAAPTEGGGFDVVAELPVDASADAERG